MNNAILKDKILGFLNSIDKTPYLKDISDELNIDIDICFFLLTEMDLVGHIKLEKMGNNSYAIILKQLGRGFFKTSSYKKEKQKEDIDYRLKKVQYWPAKYWWVVMILTSVISAIIAKYI